VISKIKLECFRGATKPVEIVFEKSRKLSLLFGENGSGKSTFVDAVDLVCNGNPGSIGEISCAKTSEHLHSLGTSQAQLKVEIECQGVTFVGRVQGSRILIGNSPPPPVARVLRRSKLLSLVTAIPSKRFDELKRLIDIDRVLRCEDKLKSTINNTARKVESKSAEIESAQTSLYTAYMEERTIDEQGLTAKEWAKARVERSPESLEEDARTLNNIRDLWEQAEVLLETKNSRQLQLNSARIALKDRNTALETLLESLPEVIADIVPVLNFADTYFEVAPNSDHCPVCLQPIFVNDVRTGIADRLRYLKSLDEHQKSVKDAMQSVEHLEKTTGEIYSDLASRLKTFLEHLFSASSTVQETVPLDLAVFSSLRTWDGELTRPIIDVSNMLLDKLGDLKQSAYTVALDIQKRANLLGSIRRTLHTLEQAETDASRAKQALERLQRTLDVVRKTRIEFVNRILDDVADDCDSIYQRIHPGEDIGAVRFKLDEERRGSLHQSGTFAGQPDKIPQAYFSESHLDTLGFCFFIALARHTTNGNCIVVLDDVFASVDLRHIQRILNLLIEEGSCFQQIILATHQRRWIETIKTHEVARNAVQIKELLTWSLNEGIVVNEVATHVENLRQAADNPRAMREELAGKAGRALEMIFGTMTRFLRVSLQRNPEDRHTAVELINAMKKPAKKLRFHREGQVDDTSAPKLRELLDEVSTSTVVVRNTLGGHFNWDGCDIDNHTVRKFAADTLQVVDIFLCSECESLPTREAAGFLVCRCGKRGVLKDWR